MSAPIDTTDTSHETEPAAGDRKAVSVARLIAREINDANWAVGTRLGTESDLLARLQTGRKTLREALRILEQQSVVRVEPGQSGGIFVKAPALDAFSNSLRTYIEMCGSPLADVLAAYEPMAHLLLDLAMTRMTPARANDLRATFGNANEAAPTRYEEAMRLSEPVLKIGEIAQNKCLSSLVHMLHRLVADFAHHENFDADFWRSHVKTRQKEMASLVERVISRNSSSHDSLNQIQASVRQNMSRLESTDPDIWNSASFLHGAYASTLIARGGPQKAALVLAYSIAADIQLSEINPEARIGTHDEIAIKYGVSLRTAIEAVRMLEFFGIVQTLRGRAAGVKVIEPDPSTVIDTACLYLSYHDPIPEDIRIVRNHLEPVAISRATEIISDFAIQSLIRRIYAALNGNRNQLKAELRNCYLQLIGLSGNQVLELIIAVLVQADCSGTPPMNEGTRDLAALSTTLTELSNALEEPQGQGLESCLLSLCQSLPHYFLY